jgi:hypothetical protein
MRDAALGGFSFRMSGRLYPADGCTCLFRSVEAEEMANRYLFLTKDGRFAYLARVVGGKGIAVAEEWNGDRAMRFLIQHGEGDLVEEFPAIFAKRAPAPVPPSKARSIAVSPKGRPAEPYLFPLN